MKIPQTFRRENLDKKIRQLVKGANTYDSIENPYLEKIKIMAGLIAAKDGVCFESKIDQEKTLEHVYFDTGTNIGIDYICIIDSKDKKIKHFNITINHDGENVYKENEEKILDYKIGDWEEKILHLYNESS